MKPFGGDPYTTATSTRDTPQDNEVVTVDYLSKNNGLVHLSGIETITGSKTFTGDILILGAASGAGGDLSPQIDLLFADLNEYEAPATAKECGFVVHQGPANGSRSIGGTQFYLKTDGTNEARISVASLLERKATSLSVFYPPTGAPYATAPNTRETPQDNEIVTVDFLKKYVAEALSGFPEPELQPTVPDAGV